MAANSHRNGPKRSASTSEKKRAIGAARREAASQARQVSGHQWIPTGAAAVVPPVEIPDISSPGNWPHRKPRISKKARTGAAAGGACNGVTARPALGRGINKSAGEPRPTLEGGRGLETSRGSRS